LQLKAERTEAPGLSICVGTTRVDKKTVDQDRAEAANTAAHKAEELMEAAAYTPITEGRLWRLEWAQAFRKLAELGRDKRKED
jgi:hypothetical protein